MAEEVADRLERSSLAEQMQGQSVPHAVRSAAGGKTYPGAPRPRTERVPDGARPERTERELDPEKQAAVRRGGPASSQVLQERRPDLVGQRQEQGRADLGPWNADLAGTPGDVVEAQSADLDDIAWRAR